MRRAPKQAEAFLQIAAHDRTTLLVLNAILEQVTEMSHRRAITFSHTALKIRNSI
ncbi:MAG: hypothetical protein GY725_18020 [bacterium]|nr:hypothetical protein [bacterium]